MRLNALANAIREELLSAEGVKKLVLNRRAAAVFSVGTPANHVFFLEAGLVKIERMTEANKEILLSVVAPGEIFGEQALIGEGAFSVSAKVLESGVAYSIPTDAFQRFCERRPEVWRLLMQHLLLRKEELERKIEHLCHSDVKERLVYYLEESGAAESVARSDRQRDSHLAERTGQPCRRDSGNHVHYAECSGAPGSDCARSSAGDDSIARHASRIGQRREHGE